MIYAQILEQNKSLQASCQALPYFNAEVEATFPSTPYLRKKRREMYMGLYMFCSWRATLEEFFLCPLTYFKSKTQISF